MYGFNVKMFFNSKEVISAVDTATRKVLSKFGAFVRRTARQSIRKRKSVSKPGQPPTNQTGKLKRHIYFGYDTNKQSVVIGPQQLSGTLTVLSALEYGGTSYVRENKQVPGPRGGMVRLKTKRAVYIRPRPFMGPAFQKELPQLPELWRNSVKTF